MQAPTTAATARPTPRGAAMSTEEIKAHLEAMFARDETDATDRRSA
ncbi:hypothetical protein [Rhodococcus daqingensis]|uniref:Uncharacterized protein n=1 Tax=Rhodococcus daqingensis TaxID=2479363 RepID=A0ABW2RRZ2_9NOCA